VLSKAALTIIGNLFKSDKVQTPASLAEAVVEVKQWVAENLRLIEQLEQTEQKPPA
jgi:hypothetical protein